MADKELGLRVTAKGTQRAKKGIEGVRVSISRLRNQMLLGTLAAGLLTVGFKKLIGLASEQERVEKKLAQTIKSTGMAAGFTFDELTKMASALQDITTFGDEAIIESQSLLATFTNIGKDVFPEALKAVLDVSVGMGQDLKSSAIQLGKALNDPILGISALSRTGITFNDVQKDMIKTMVDAGDTAGAQAVILEELNKQFGGQAEAAAKGFGTIDQLGNSLGDLGEVLGQSIGKSSLFQNAIYFLKNSTDDLIGALSEARIEIEGLTSTETELVKIERELIKNGIQLETTLERQIDAGKTAKEEEQRLIVQRKIAAAEAKGEAVAIFDVVGAFADESLSADESSKSLLKRRKELQKQIKEEKELAKVVKEKPKPKPKAKEEEKEKEDDIGVELDFEKFRAEEKQKIIDEQRKKDLEQQQIFNESKNELATNQFDLERQKLQESFLSDFEIVKGNDEAVTALREARQVKMNEIDKRETDFFEEQQMRKIDIAKQTTGFLADNLSLLASEVKEFSGIAQVAAIADATVAGYEAAIHSFKFGAKLGGPILGGIFSAISLGATGALISKIAATSFQTSEGMTRTVPGASTERVLIPAHGGEEIGRRSGASINITVNGAIDPDATGQAVFTVLNKFMKVNGVSFA